MKNILVKTQKFQKPAVWMLLAINMIMAGGYVYAINRTVFNVVASTKAEKAIAENMATMTDLESRHASLKSKITLDFAYSQGFRDASNQQVFIVKKPLAKTLSFNAL